MAFRGIRLLHRVPNLDYFRWHKLFFALSAAMVIGTFALLATRGLNFGVDFAGGILIEIRSTQGEVKIADVRTAIASLGVGEANIQESGKTDVLIRIERQEGGEGADQAALKRIRAALPGFEFRRVDVVGPRAGNELVTNGTLAFGLALGGILAYMAFRFGWQAGLSGVVAVAHDCITMVGMFAVTGWQFDLNVLAAAIAIAGFSVNDKVVIDDRIRENGRKYKSMPFKDIINLSVNQTLGRTMMTNGLLFLAVLALLIFGGPALRSLSVAMVWGVISATYSTVFVSAPMEWYLVGRNGPEGRAATGGAPAGKAS